MIKNMEILAPAGNFESLESALRCGADAVYIGGKYFSARGNASNFSNDEIADACRLCHLYGAKLYIAVNTVIADSEADAFCKYIKYTSSAGIDAYIVQDWGCIYLIKKCVPDAVIHASTQMTIHTPKGAEFAKSLGFSRIVPARELSCEKTEEITNYIPETEVFVHGALCMSVSGQCYFSAMIGSRSANRGVCGQVCRLPFSSCGNKKFSALSLKDLTLLNHIRELEKCGVCSLKIEGRMKRPEYVASAVTETKKALSGQIPDIEMLKSVFSRDGFTDGYFTGKRNHMFGTRSKDDSDRDLLPCIREYYKKQPQIYSLEFKVNITENQKAKLSAYCPECNLYSYAEGEIPEKALKKPLDLEYTGKQLSKLGDTLFKFIGVSGFISEGVILKASELNNLRREAVQKMEEKIIEKNTPHYSVSEYSPEIPTVQKSEIKNTEIRIQCRNARQAKYSEPFADMLIIPADECMQAVEYGIDVNKICIAPPRFITDEREEIFKITELKSMGINHLLCVNPAYIQTGNELGMILHGGFGLNVTNSFSCKMLAESGLDDITLSFEMKLSQLKKINSPIPRGIIAYGQLPLMLVRNCPVSNESGCAKCTGSITDRTGRIFPVRCHKKEYAEIFNSDTLYINKKDFSEFDFVLIMLGDENAEQIKDLSENFGRTDFKHPNMTKGLYYRGIINETQNKKNE